MNLKQLFCPNIDCPARGHSARGNIIVHSQKEKRCLCTVCEKSFAITKGTLFYRLHTDPKIVMCVIVLMAYGCPPQAIVKAFGYDERTVKKVFMYRALESKGPPHPMTHLMGICHLSLDRALVIAQQREQWKELFDKDIKFAEQHKLSLQGIMAFQ